jgi:diguanylate cyclase (GGDEF)-like protein
VLSVSGVLAVNKVTTLFSSKKALIFSVVTALQNDLKKIKNQDDIVLSENERITQSLEEIETLYKGMKLMNTTLEFEKTLQIFCDLLTKLTSFEDGQLITIEEKNGKNEIQNVFRLSRSEEDTTWVSLQESELSDFQKTVFEKTIEQNELIFEDCSRKSFLFTDQEIPQNIRTILSVPLVKQNHVIAVLILQQCQKSDIEKIRIMVIQLTMELEKVHFYEMVKELSVIDGLTKLYLRRHLFSLLKNEIERLGERKLPLSLLMIDIDRFKSYNDQFGHLVGDMILRHLRQFIKQNFRQIDIIGRYGGEEFIIALPETTKEMALGIAERFRESIERQRIDIYDNQIQFTISIGISSYPHDANSLMGLINKADKALYTAKSEGRNRVEIAQ